MTPSGNSAMTPDDFARSREAVADRAPPKPGYPVAEGSPTIAYLEAIVTFAVIERREVALERYAKVGLIFKEHGLQVLDAMDRAPQGVSRFDAGMRAVERIRRELGAWAERPAKDYVEAASRE